AATEGIAFQDDWPYAIHLLGHIYVNDMYAATNLSYSLTRVSGDCCVARVLRVSFFVESMCSNSARYLWKMTPAGIKENRPEVAAAWKIGQRLWTRDYGGVYEAIREFNWSPEARDLVSSFAGKFPPDFLCSITIM
ncbi:hypothetical protein RJ639_021321, partial [Escallonia herrerae]